MKPIQFSDDLWIVLWWALHEQFKHVVVVAFDKGPIAARVFTLDQQVNHTAAVWATIGVVTQEHNLCILAAIFFNQI